MLSVIPQGLTQEEAKLRVQQVKDVEYHLSFQFRRNQPFFTAELLLKFCPKKGPLLENLFLDATELTIQQIQIDSHEIPESFHQIQNRRIALPPEYFSSSNKPHEVWIRYQGSFHSNQVGFFRFYDQETQEDYFFTHLEPYGANKVFPCFDQPDIPGRFSVVLKFPCGWQAVTNTYFQIEPETENEEEQFWRSQQSLPFSTYLFALALGPLKMVQNEKYPHIRLYLRPNRIENPQNFFDASFLFETAAHNLAFFERQFDTPHPYEKLDLVGVPSYINGGMENVGAIFLSETQMVTSEPPSQFQRYNQFLLISHEISHLWFGDLVTMAWWNDLWLKESFATLMSYEAAAQISYFRDEV
ncbi:MAG: M1 family aminopeptidase [Planctomycetota bacterium]